eukprot:2824149-Alexandrium_andersonii.AAC.1
MIHVITSCACAWANRCEYTYMYGPANSGKDMVRSLILAFLGLDGGYCAVLPRHFFGAETTRDPEAPTSVLDMLRGARYVANNEVPEHKTFAA